MQPERTRPKEGWVRGRAGQPFVSTASSKDTCAFGVLLLSRPGRVTGALLLDTRAAKDCSGLPSAVSVLPRSQGDGSYQSTVKTVAAPTRGRSSFPPLPAPLCQVAGLPCPGTQATAASKGLLVQTAYWAAVGTPWEPHVAPGAGPLGADLSSITQHPHCPLPPPTLREHCPPGRPCPRRVLLD